MASSKSQYPGHLNPFGSDDETDPSPFNRGGNLRAESEIEYPDHLDPFNINDDVVEPCLASTDAYDDSLNPFGIEGEEEPDQAKSCLTIEKSSGSIDQDSKNGETNPFADKSDHETKQQEDAKSADQDKSTVPQRSPSPDISEPPRPLPRTKSLLKKELAQKKRLQEQQTITDYQTSSIQSTASSTTSTSSMNEANKPNPVNSIASFQRQKNKRLAPPVPVNFKRQVSGSLDEIEEELEGIGDKLAIIDKESVICQQTLTGEAVTESAMQTTRSKYVELIKRRNSIVRRQRELMYKKRELKLDQLYSDIEYELRMIGNKQQSTRTSDDESKEKELLKKLVDIVEEKNDIVENLNKDTSCDSRDVEEAFRRLNIKEHAQDVSDKKHVENAKAHIVSKSGTCDKKGIVRLSKIATLLPRSDAIKMKRKRLFKKNCDSRPIER